MTRFTIGHDHPSLPGHFPGRPVVPGVVLLAHAFAAIEHARREATGTAAPPVRRIETAKFLAPVQPDEVVDVTWREAAPGRLDFECASLGRTVLRGRVLLAEAP